MRAETINQQWAITDDNGREWEISFSKYRNHDKKFILTTKSDAGGYLACGEYDECIHHIEQSSKPPFVELTLEDFRVAASRDTNVVYINNETGVGFTFLCAELKFASMGTRYNSAAEVIAAINAERRKEYDANR